ncbi:amidohydrolase family protein [Kineosporia sp. J2-2]|uniref:Amidohydrolase family protein n=1 Tax=Kineosporia corallincola TaxID=2835133 RepID=A0ABS5TM94_9ACTN|nr:amidohydrolase family protein [Kineosporia corallincola]MBT0770724.1 amidohydrolase family protein [Kineosporia corallincola]
MVAGLILREARLVGSAGLVDVVVRDGRITSVLRADDEPPAVPTGLEEVRLDGRWLGAGLWDSHVHFTQWVTLQRRVDLSGTGSPEEALAVVAEALAARPADGRPLVGYGFRDGLWPHPPSLAALDAVAPDRPVVLVSGDLHCGWVNTKGAALLGITPDEFGLVRETEWIGADHRQLGGLPEVGEYRETALAAARRGVVGVVEFENADNLTDWPARVAAGVDALRVQAAVWPDRLDAAVAAGLRSGDPLDPEGLITFGRLKVVVDGSLNTRTALCHDPYPGLDPAHPHACGVQSVHPSQLRELLETAYRNGVEAAVHAIGDKANQQVVDEFERLGVAGTIEHAQLVGAADFERFGRLGLIASIQPEHAMDDRDVADRHWAGRTDRAFAFRSLHEAGAVLRLGSDAPVAPLDPWISIAAAVGRSRDGREPWHPEQRIPLSVALEASTRSRVAEGEPADLVVLDHDPTTLSAEKLRELPVAATLLGGRWTWNSL